MKRLHQKLAVLMVLGAAALSGGCIDAFQTGFAGGVDGAISSVVESIITRAFQPITEEPE